MVLWVVGKKLRVHRRHMQRVPLKERRHQSDHSAAAMTRTTEQKSTITFSVSTRKILNASSVAHCVTIFKGNTLRRPARRLSNSRTVTRQESQNLTLRFMEESKPEALSATNRKESAPVRRS